jgi:hypothetical protein
VLCTPLCLTLLFPHSNENRYSYEKAPLRGRSMVVVTDQKFVTVVSSKSIDSEDALWLTEFNPIRRRGDRDAHAEPLDVHHRIPGRRFFRVEASFLSST